MELTKKERLGFIYQLKILEALYPEDATYFAQQRTALEDGFAFHYAGLVERLNDELSDQDCREVLDILDMYRAITFSLRELDKGDALHEHGLAKFRGFDGNNEGQRMAYVRYYIVDLDRYDELKEGKIPSFNSHMPMLPTYRKMLGLWEGNGKQHRLSREQIANILGTD